MIQLVAVSDCMFQALLILALVLHLPPVSSLHDGHTTRRHNTSSTMHNNTEPQSRGFHRHARYADMEKLYTWVAGVT